MVSKAVKITLSILLGLSLIMNMAFIFSFGVRDLQWEKEYSDLYVSSCELLNDYARFSNDLIINLQSYDESWNDLQLMEVVNCWEE